MKISLPFRILLWALANSAAGAAIGFAIAAFREGSLDGQVIWISILFGNVVGFTAIISAVYLFPRFVKLPTLVQLVLQTGTLLGGSVLGTAVVIQLYPLFLLHEYRTALRIIVVNGVVATIVGTLLFSYEAMRARLRESLRVLEEVRLKESELRTQAARAQLAALQARIKPHFFFNTLNTISALLAEDPAKADEVVQTLAGLFRYTFKAAHADAVTLGEELEFVEGYLAVEKARFGDRLKVAWSVDPDARAARVPGLVLQPLVENAVGHGIAPAPGGGTVRISGRVLGGRVVVEVEDDGVGLAAEGISLIREDHGLGNVRKRVASASRGEGELQLLPASRGRGALARIVLPYVPAPVAAIRERTA